MAHAADPGRGRSLDATAVVVLLAIAVTLQVDARPLAPPPPDAPPMLWMQSPAAARRIMLSFTDLAADLYWMRAVSTTAASGVDVGPAPRLRAAVPAARPGDDARSALRRGGAPGRDLPERRLSRRPGPHRPGASQLLEKGLARRPGPLAVPPRHRLRPLLVAERLPRGGAPVRAAPAGCRTPRMAADDGRRDAGQGRRPRRGAQLWSEISPRPTCDGCGAAAEYRPAAAARRSTRSTR